MNAGVMDAGCARRRSVADQRTTRSTRKGAEARLMAFGDVNL